LTSTPTKVTGVVVRPQRAAGTDIAVVQRDLGLAQAGQDVCLGVIDLGTQPSMRQSPGGAFKPPRQPVDPVGCQETCSGGHQHQVVERGNHQQHT
jgi:hypothetical protein